MVGVGGRIPMVPTLDTVLISTEILPLPFLVVTNITPPAAREPYTEADPPFSTLILSMSLGFISLNDDEFIEGIPSITIKGSIPLIDEAPLIKKLTPSSPGLDEVRVTTRPGVLP